MNVDTCNVVLVQMNKPRVTMRIIIIILTAVVVITAIRTTVSCVSNRKKILHSLSILYYTDFNYQINLYLLIVF